MPGRERGRTPEGFRTQLLQRLRQEALRTGASPQRLQQSVVFERFLARLPKDGTWTLKGGFALQLRYGLSARTTRDIDLRITGQSDDAFSELRQVSATSTIADQFTFEFGEMGQEMQGAPGGTLRIRVRARVAGRELTTFHVDLSSGDVLLDPPDFQRGSDLLGFAGVEPIEFPVYPITQHLAEKLHAYTLPRERENTRIKDLVDLVFIAITEQVAARQLASSVNATFAIRGSHPVPARLPAPPPSWTQPFLAIAADTTRLTGIDLSSGYQIAAGFWNPLLESSASLQVWLPNDRCWDTAVQRVDDA